MADYNEKTNHAVGVVLSDEPFDDIEAFCLTRGRVATDFYGINLEEYETFISGIPNCECFFIPVLEKDKNWILFLELKYCKPENIASYGHDVVVKMDAILKKLITEGLIDPSRYRVYFNYSSPNNEAYAPFAHFMRVSNTTQKILDELKNTFIDANFLGENSLLAATPQYIQILKRPI